MSKKLGRQMVAGRLAVHASAWKALPGHQLTRVRVPSRLDAQQVLMRQRSLHCRLCTALSKLFAAAWKGTEQDL